MSMEVLVQGKDYPKEMSENHRTSNTYSHETEISASKFIYTYVWLPLSQLTGMLVLNHLLKNGFLVAIAK